MMLLNKVCVFHVEVPIPAIPPLGFETEPARKNFSDILV